MGCCQSSEELTSAATGGTKYRIKKDARIVILGAGPAGLHLALRLKEKGCTDVTILEKTCRYGGKTYTVTKFGSPNDIGAAWMHPGYTPVIELVRKYGAGPIAPPGTGLGRARDAVLADGSCLSCGDWLFDDSEAAVIPRWMRPLLPDTLIQQVPMGVAIKKYIGVHRQIFGKYSYSLPPEPSPEGKRRIAKSFGQFLKDEGLEEILAVVLIIRTAQGYGFLEELPAFYGLSWMTPKLVSAFAAGADAAHPPQHDCDVSLLMLLRHGFGHLWDRIVEVEKPRIRYGTQVHSIRRRGLEPGLKAPIVIDAACPKPPMDADERLAALELKGGSVPRDFFSLYPTPRQVAAGVFDAVARGDPPGVKTEAIEADHLFVAAPFDAVLPLMESATWEEREIVGGMKPMTLVASLFTSPAVFRAPIVSMVAAEGRLCSARHTRAVNNPALRPRSDGREPYVGHQLFKGRLGAGEVEAAKQVMQEDLEKYGYEHAKIDKYCAFNTFLPHFSVDGVCDKRYPWRILEMQGLNDTCWVGSSACFESVLDVVNYNNLLVDQKLQFD